uniref:Uncharacterized protein n=1 Tax=Kalanchoe fedtschenkoi TaxID=63787 RepID=A0A7N0UB61_KALFE
MLILAASNFVDGIGCVLSGIVRGCGKQKIGVYWNLAAYYLVGIPISVTLAFEFHTGAKGLWIGIMAAVFVQVIALLVVTFRTNWEKEAVKAKERVVKSSLGEGSVSV